MGVSAIGTRANGSFGVEKSNRDAIVDETQQLDADEYNRVADALIEVQEAIGTTVSPEAGTLEARAVAAAAAIAGLGALATEDAIATAMISDDAVTLAKMAAGTAGNLITYDASGNPAAVATGTSGQVLKSNGAGAAPTFQDATVAVRSILTGSTYVAFSTVGAEVLIGGFVFDPAAYAVAPTLVLKALAMLTTADASGYLEIRLYDMGDGTGAFTPVLRSTLSVAYAAAGQARIISQALTLSATPGVDADQIHTTARGYELRAYLSATSATGQVTWSGLAIS